MASPLSCGRSTSARYEHMSIHHVRYAAGPSAGSDALCSLHCSAVCAVLLCAVGSLRGPRRLLLQLLLPAVRHLLSAQARTGLPQRALLVHPTRLHPPLWRMLLLPLPAAGAGHARCVAARGGTGAACHAGIQLRAVLGGYLLPFPRHHGCALSPNTPAPRTCSGAPLRTAHACVLLLVVVVQVPVRC